MVKKVIWTPRAKKTFQSIIDYLEKEWTEKEIANFVNETNHVISIAAKTPEAFRKSGKVHIREALITKHNLLIYRVKGEEIYLLTFWTTRKNPKRKRIK